MYISSLIAAVLLLLFLAATNTPRAAGIPEPGVTLYGQVVADDGSLVTAGRLVWTYTRQDTLTPLEVAVSTDLAAIDDGAGTTFSYQIHIPAEMPVGADPISPNYLPAVEPPATYLRAATLDGALTAIPSASDTTSFGYADRGAVERVDLFVGIHGPPDPPSQPAPVDGALLVALDTALDWGDTARAETYDLYLWRAGFIKPIAPTVENLTASRYQPPALLRPDADYLWQIVARNTRGETAGPVWTFRTAFAGDLQILLEYLLGKRTLTFDERSQLDLNGDGNLDVADLVRGLKQTSYLIKLPDGDAVRQTTSTLGQRGIGIGSAWVRPRDVVPIVLSVNLERTVAGAAGVNFHIETDPAVIEFTGVRANFPNAGEDLYHHSPNAGVLNVVFFANPVQSLVAGNDLILWIDAHATPVEGWTESRVAVTAAAVTETNGITCEDVVLADGWVRLITPSTPARHWPLYR